MIGFLSSGSFAALRALALGPGRAPHDEIVGRSRAGDVDVVDRRVLDEVARPPRRRRRRCAGSRASISGASARSRIGPDPLVDRVHLEQADEALDEHLGGDVHRRDARHVAGAEHERILYPSGSALFDQLNSRWRSTDWSIRLGGAEQENHGRGCCRSRPQETSTSRRPSARVRAPRPKVGRPLTAILFVGFVPRADVASRYHRAPQPLLAGNGAIERKALRFAARLDPPPASTRMSSGRVLRSSAALSAGGIRAKCLR